jgi:hypothetical protein
VRTTVGLLVLVCASGGRECLGCWMIGAENVGVLALGEPCLPSVTEVGMGVCRCVLCEAFKKSGRSDANLPNCAR